MLSFEENIFWHIFMVDSMSCNEENYPKYVFIKVMTQKMTA